MGYTENYNYWLSNENLDKDTVAELKEIADNEEEKEFRFIKPLDFGTAGLRGQMMAGINAMNVYTVAHATQALATLILKLQRQNEGVIIGYDSRLNSPLFAKTTAEVLAGNGIRSFIFDELRPSPLISFSVRELGCVCGINITASHNPKKYNGYKVFWDDGAQISPEIAKEISDIMANTDIFTGVKSIAFEEGIKSGIISYANESIDEKFIDRVIEQSVSPDAIRKVADNFKVVYTPLHGAGYKFVPKMLKKMGLTGLYPVEEQMIPDGNFPTAPSPNPEYEEVFPLGIELAKKVNSDLVVATDPDADRLGIMVRAKDGNFVRISGNQVGALLLDYIITAYEESGTMPTKPYAVKTIVTTELVSKICALHNVDLYNVLTGFKNIGEVIKTKETEEPDAHYIFGFEESYGYLKGTYARDKDSVVAAMLVCEMAAYYKAKDMTLYDAMNELYKKYGYFNDESESIFMEGLDGLERMTNIMSYMRNNPFSEIGGHKVIEIRDYLTDTVKNIITGKITKTGLDRSNVLYYKTEENDVIVIRPSGTEPKIKMYYLVGGKDKESAVNKTKKYRETILETVK